MGDQSIPEAHHSLTLCTKPEEWNKENEYGKFSCKESKRLNENDELKHNHD